MVTSRERERGRRHRGCYGLASADGCREIRGHNLLSILFFRPPHRHGPGTTIDATIVSIIHLVPDPLSIHAYPSP